MRIIREMEVFTFDELDESAQIVAMEHMREFLWEVLNSDNITEELNGELIHICGGHDVGAISSKKLKDEYEVTIDWSISYVQSDFLSVRGRFTKEHFPKLFINLPITEFTTTTNVNGWTQVCNAGWDSDEGFTELSDKELFAVRTELRDLERHLFVRAKDLIEDYTSEEVALEQLRNGFNTRRFVANGKCAPTLFWSDDMVVLQKDARWLAEKDAIYATYLATRNTL